jgi:hypothetical protein
MEVRKGEGGGQGVSDSIMIGQEIFAVLAIRSLLHPATETVRSTTSHFSETNEYLWNYICETS